MLQEFNVRLGTKTVLESFSKRSEELVLVVFKGQLMEHNTVWGLVFNFCLTNIQYLSLFLLLMFSQM